MGAGVKRARTVALPRPKGTRATSRASLTITMHPRELAELERRAAAASMSLTGYVAALLASDADDIAPARKRDPKVNWLEDRDLGELIPRRCGEIVLGLPCAMPRNHPGPHDASYMRGELATFINGERVPLNESHVPLASLEYVKARVRGMAK